LDKEFKVNNELKKILRMVLAFSIPVFILGLVYYRLKIIPFGDNSLLTIDLKNQYISYFSYLKNSMLGNDSLFYSFSKTLSGNMIGLVGYYLISPFNILFLFANVSNFTLIITIITLLKTGTAALTMYIYFRSKNIEGIPLYILSTSYALSGYMVIYQQNIMWLDAVILLPLVVLGIDYIFDKNQVSLYIITFTFLMLTNYYIGFMVAIFVVFYFIASAIEFLYNKKGRFKDTWVLFIEFTFSSLLAGGISSIVWLPSVLSYSGSSKVAFDIKELMDMNSNFTLTEFLSKFIIGATNRGQIVEGLPNIYIPTSLVILGLLFLMNSKINVGVKIKYTLLIFTMYFSFKYVGLNKIWHGFTNPTWFPYRNSFIFIFLIVSIAGIQFKKMYITFPKLIFILVISILVFINVNSSGFDYIHKENIRMSFFITIVTVILLALIINKKEKKHFVFLSLLGLIFIETNYNSYLTLEENSYYNANEYTNFVRKTAPTIDKYNPDGHEFYRIEKTFSYSENDPLLLNYSGLSHYSSNEVDNVKDFLGNMGYRNSGNWTIYSNGSSLFADSLLSVKYIITDNNSKNYLDLVEENEQFSVYHNPYAFPLGFLTNYHKEIKDIENSNTFEYQNDLIDSLFEVDNVYQKVPKENIKIKTENLEYNKEENKHIYSKINKEEEAFLILDVTGIEESNQLNVFFMDDKLYDPGKIYFDNEYYGKVLDMYENNIYTYTPQSNHVEVKIKLIGNKLVFNQASFYSNKINQIKELYTLAETNKLDIEDFSPSNIKGEVPIKEVDSHLIMTIPYDDSWQAVLDGNKANTLKINDVFLGIEIPKNSRKLELKFIPKGLYVAMTISIISSIIFLLVYLKDRNMNK